MCRWKYIVCALLWKIQVNYIALLKNDTGGFCLRSVMPLEKLIVLWPAFWNVLCTWCFELLGNRVGIVVGLIELFMECGIGLCLEKHGLLNEGCYAWTVVTCCYGTFNCVLKLDCVWKCCEIDCMKLLWDLNAITFNGLCVQLCDGTLNLKCRNWHGLVYCFEIGFWNGYVLKMVMMWKWTWIMVCNENGRGLCDFWILGFYVGDG